MKKSILFLLFLLILLLTLFKLTFAQDSGSPFKQEYEDEDDLSWSSFDTIPPEILNSYDPDIVSGKRPVIVRINKEMIWNLRESPDLGGDVYSFDLQPSALSSVQQDIIKTWVKNGKKILFFGFEEVKNYAMLFEDAITYDTNKNLGNVEYILASHPVNIGVRNVKFYNYDGSIWPKISFLLDTYPSDTEALVSIEYLSLKTLARKTGIVAGRIPYGSGSIYVALIGNQWKKGTDGDRWLLNFLQWMLDKRLPETDGVLSTDNN